MVIDDKYTKRLPYRDYAIVYSTVNQTIYLN